MKLGELAELTGSTLETGSPEVEIGSANGLDLAREGDITFLANTKYASQVATTKASAIFIGEGVAIDRPDMATLRATDPQLAFARAMQIFFPQPQVENFVHPTASVHPSAEVATPVEIHANVVIGSGCRIGKGVRIMPNATIYEGVSIGENTTLHSGVSVREHCEIGRNCIIHNNSTIGADGFGYAKDEQKRWVKIPQTGRVVIEDDVEIGANTAVDRASVGETRVRRGAKLDNLVQIGHSCLIDEDALICSQTGLAGSTEVGKRVVLAGQVGVAGHLKIGDDVTVSGQSGITKNIEPGRFVSGLPAIDNRSWRRSAMLFTRLGEFFDRLRKLEKKVFDEHPAEPK